MENAEVSVLYDGMNDAQQLANHHKRALFMDNSDANIDSGYSSNFSISHNHTSSNSTKLGNLTNSPRHTSSFKRSLGLETISENRELRSGDSVNLETPTTRSLRHFSALDIQSPTNPKILSETTPTKTNYFSSGLKSSRKKSRNRIEWSPYKCSPSKQQSSFKASSFGINDENVDFRSNNENLEHSFEQSLICNNSIIFSPIDAHNSSNAGVQRQGSKRVLQRHASGIESSTPKATNFRRTKTQSILKSDFDEALPNQVHTRLLRKTQSFSPAKRSALRESNIQNLGNVESGEIDAQNPVHKMLAFSDQQFGQLVQFKAPPTSATPPKVKQIAIEHNVNASIQSPRKRAEISKNRSRLVGEFSSKKSLKSIAVLSETTCDTLNASDIAMSLAGQSPYQNQRLMDAKITTPSTHIDDFSSFAVTPMRSDVTEHSIREEANRTPVKRFEQCANGKGINKKSSPEKEMHDIIYGELPTTPPKKSKIKSLKRHSSVLSDSSSLPNEPSAKRKLYEICERPPTIDGIENVDILLRLVNNDRKDEIKTILSYLDGKDLQAAYCVSKSWSKIVDSIKECKTRRIQYVRIERSVKENRNPYQHSKMQLRNRTTTNNNNSNHNNNNNVSSEGPSGQNTVLANRKPFSDCNSQFSAKNQSVQRSPPASPSTRKFRENQKVNF